MPVQAAAANSPVIATTADPAVTTINSTVRDTARVTGGANPNGTVTFRLFSDAACTVQVFTSTNALVAETVGVVRATSDPLLGGQVQRGPEQQPVAARPLQQPQRAGRRDRGRDDVVLVLHDVINDALHQFLDHLVLDQLNQLQQHLVDVHHVVVGPDRHHQLVDVLDLVDVADLLEQHVVHHPTVDVHLDHRALDVDLDLGGARLDHHPTVDVHLDRPDEHDHDVHDTHLDLVLDVDLDFDQHVDVDLDQHVHVLHVHVHAHVLDVDHVNHCRPGVADHVALYDRGPAGGGDPPGDGQPPGRRPRRQHNGDRERVPTRSARPGPDVQRPRDPRPHERGRLRQLPGGGHDPAGHARWGPHPGRHRAQRRGRAQAPLTVSAPSGLVGLVSQILAPISLSPPLARTGSDSARDARLAVILVVVGAVLVAGTWRDARRRPFPRRRPF